MFVSEECNQNHIQEALGLLLTSNPSYCWPGLLALLRQSQGACFGGNPSFPASLLACLYLFTYHKALGPADNMCVQDSLKAEITLAYCRSPVYIIVQLCACYEMTYSFEAWKRPSIYASRLRLALFTTYAGMLGLRGVWLIKEILLSQTGVQQTAKTHLVLYLPICKDWRI